MFPGGACRRNKIWLEWGLSVHEHHVPCSTVQDRTPDMVFHQAFHACSRREAGEGLLSCLSTDDHHLVVVSWIHWQRRMLDRNGRPKRIVRVCWERLAEEPSVKGGLQLPPPGRNSHRFRGREAGDIESEWTMFSLPPLSTQAASKLWTQGLWCLSWWRRQPPNLVVDPGSKEMQGMPSD
ncbi:hypothetical protein L3Q82_016614 [Scortum barcoo]|uniref:Uncharacterized protein n=1 Tax=Scortum barcoo TaxID=214431 RepID=A0ACB8X7S4_9TELE|nr:hypothetical protein L3Q82_016614 [Scortum barcoo]